LASPSKATVEQCWILVGYQRAPFWYARRVQQTSGQPDQVAFDASWALQREEVRGDVIGFYHTHPSGFPKPSQRDNHTMHAWVNSFGKPLLCLIEADAVVHGYFYASDTLEAIRIDACQRMKRNIVLIYHGKKANG